MEFSGSGHELLLHCLLFLNQFELYFPERIMNKLSVIA